ncbi:Catechol 2,3-dioxygenase [Chitinasiproducens palmae]|uniref:Bleomycin resistance protein n=2 Tax=Chitinasiproducens palmae TaxID=1770053 RepID=A0A1H2PLQ4_9BURK|nr:Catechol 2,3-dioxygenase [Chitinasiproducens palmae]
MPHHDTTFGKAVPVLASLDMPRTLAFYRDVLGFQTHSFEDASYGIATRGAVEIHFWRCGDRVIAENTSCYIHVADIESLHAELTTTVADLLPVRRTPWGMAELYVHDPDGNLIKFGQAFDANDSPATPAASSTWSKRSPNGSRPRRACAGRNSESASVPRPAASPTRV